MKTIELTGLKPMKNLKTIKNKFMKWLSAKTEKPKIDTKDEFSVENQQSVRVLIWIDTYTDAYFGRYYYKSKHWGVEGCTGLHSDRISHFAYIKAPINY